MLPFLDKKKMATTIMDNRKTAGERESLHAEDKAPPGLHEATAHIIEGVHAKDHGRVAKGLEMAHAHLSKGHINKKEESEAKKEEK